MPKRINYTLTDEQLAQVERAMAHDPRAEVVRRATAIRLLHQGYTPQAVGEMVSASRSSVQNWHQRWREGGLEALANKPMPGRPPKANATYREVLEQTLETDPHALGYVFSVWTLERLSQHLARETGIHLSVGRLAEWLERWGYVYRRPKATLKHKQDAQARAHVQEWLAEAKKKQPRPGLAAFSLWTKPPSALSSP
ncbi:MAG: IS630 family transposase [Anaerolineae bacterium]|nr:IS630 family transposase [Anaerolineae bacterium]